MTQEMLSVDPNYNGLTTELRSFGAHWLRNKYPNHVPVKLFVHATKDGRFFVPKFCKQIEILREYDLFDRHKLHTWKGITNMWLYELCMHKHLVRKHGINTLVSRNLYFEPTVAAIAFDCSGERPRLIGYQASSRPLTQNLGRYLKGFNTSKMTPNNIQDVLGRTFDIYKSKEKK